MKRAVYILVPALSACSVTIAPITNPEYARHGKSKSHPHLVTKKSRTVVHYVDARWLDNYLRLEKEHGNYTVPEDKYIDIQNGKVIVPDAVVRHYHDLMSVPTPSPTP
jgi:hypothetical protein